MICRVSMVYIGIYGNGILMLLLDHVKGMSVAVPEQEVMGKRKWLPLRKQTQCKF